MMHWTDLNITASMKKTKSIDENHAFIGIEMGPVSQSEGKGENSQWRTGVRSIFD